MVVKKATTKSAPKKSASKAKKQMTVVSGNMCFWVNNGPILSSIKDLHGALQKMSDVQYSHHVSKTKNDFASWVKTVLHETDCAAGLLKAKNKSEAVKCVEKTVAKYK